VTAVVDEEIEPDVEFDDTVEEPPVLELFFWFIKFCEWNDVDVNSEEADMHSEDEEYKERERVCVCVCV
jgi:hypothetical protein